MSASLPPVIYGNGNQTRDFILVDDIGVVSAIVLSAADGNKKKGRNASIVGIRTLTFGISACSARLNYAIAFYLQPPSYLISPLKMLFLASNPANTTPSISDVLIAAEWNSGTTTYPVATPFLVRSGV